MNGMANGIRQFSVDRSTTISETNNWTINNLAGLEISVVLEDERSERHGKKSFIHNCGLLIVKLAYLTFTALVENIRFLIFPEIASLLHIKLKKFKCCDSKA